jgi:gamma-glutamyltranspeptidase / glutathione hydrolase
MATARQPLGRLVLASLALAASIAALGSFASGAGAAGSDPYSLRAEALLSSTQTDLTLRVDGPELPALVEKVQVKAWPSGSDKAETRNFFDVPLEEGDATLHLTGRQRGELLQIRAHVKDGPQHNLETETTVKRRPDLMVTQIDVPGDLVRTRAFDVTVHVAEDGGDVGADARVLLFDGANTTALAATDVTVPAGATIPVTFRVALAEPGSHTLRAVVTDAAPAEWDIKPNGRYQELYVNHYGENGVVATDHPLATQIGVDVLRSGGNAFDAAAAVQFALNVVQPHFTGIGGASNIIIREGDTGKLFAIDARETAPAATTPTTYAVPGAVRPNGFAVGVPGTLRAVEYLLDRWGTTTLADAIEPSIPLAETGFPIGYHLAREIPVALQTGILQPETREIFLKPDGTPLAEGDTLKQPDLAKTFRLLARDGIVAFYDGEIAQAIVDAQRRAQTPGREGKMTLADLRHYPIEVEEPLSLAYKAFDVYSPGPSTSGGLVLLESLGLMREFLADPKNAGYPWGFGTRNSLHVFIEAMRLAFADRDLWIGDDRFTDVPSAGLLDREYLRTRSSLIGRETVMCNPVLPGDPLSYSNRSEVGADVDSEALGHTSHFSIIDRWGNVVVMTSTLRDAFGTGITVPGYGFLLNDSLGLFNRTPLADPTRGNPGANDAAGGKRPMGNATPTLILKDDEPFAGTGTFGSGFIQSLVLNVVVNLIEYHLPLQEAIDAPRVWIQFSNGASQLNFGFDRLIDPLRAMGHVGRPGGCAEFLNRIALPPLLNIGSTGSFGVDLENFSLLGGVDATRFPDASTAVVERD